MIPTAYGRDGDRLLLHGAAANHVLKAAAGGAELTVTVTLVDGLVLARSTFHHSINYRSVVMFGRATGDRRAATRRRRPWLAIVDHFAAGPRRATPGHPTPRNWRAPGWSRCRSTRCRRRSGPADPIDDEEDLACRSGPGFSRLRPGGRAAPTGWRDPAGVACAYLIQPGTLDGRF